MATFRFIQALLEWLLKTQLFHFDWDDGNLTKSRTKHGVKQEEAEEIFNERKWLPLGEQVSPKVIEKRYGLLGETKAGTRLFVAFAIREGKVRVISVRPMSRKERRLYDQIREE